MPTLPNTPHLYGISSTNSSRSGADLWGKNQFNTTFPLSLCLYMRDKGINPVSVICTGGKISSTDKKWNMEEVIGSDDTSYHFEKAFDGFLNFYRDRAEAATLIL